MTRFWPLAVTVAGAVLLGGCVTTGQGGVSPLALTAPAGGGLANGAIGTDLDSSAQKAAREAEYQALEFGRTGVPVPWKSGSNRGEVIPGARYQINAYSCRDFTQTILSGAERPSARGTACRQPNGSWQPVT